MMRPCIGIPLNLANLDSTITLCLTSHSLGRVRANNRAIRCDLLSF